MGQRLANKYIGCMMGSALGDAIGELAFRLPERAGLEARVGEVELLRYTDDTAMAIGLAQSLIERGTVDAEHIGKTFHRNFQREPWRGYASGPPTLFSMVASSGISYTAAAKTLFDGKGSFGNGAAMRVAPVGLFYRNAPDLHAQAGASADATHAHPLARDGAALQAFAVALALELDPEAPFPLFEFTRKLIAFAQTVELQQKMEQVQALLEQNTPCAEAARALGRSVAIHESLPFALYAFLKYPQSFEESLFCAVLSGGDRDTLGAMTGAVSGAYLGLDAIPAPWQAKLEHRELLQDLALSILRTGTSPPPHG